MKSTNEILQMLDSLCRLYWAQMENGDLDTETSADIAELMEWLVSLSIKQIGGEAA